MGSWDFGVADGDRDQEKPVAASLYAHIWSSITRPWVVICPYIGCTQLI